jgi:hypothetical protein
MLWLCYGDRRDLRVMRVGVAHDCLEGISPRSDRVILLQVVKYVF